jgi:SPX domain protein involved in polyphosphate accumulation
MRLEKLLNGAIQTFPPEFVEGCLDAKKFRKIFTKLKASLEGDENPSESLDDLENIFSITFWKQVDRVEGFLTKKLKQLTADLKMIEDTLDGKLMLDTSASPLDLIEECTAVLFSLTLRDGHWLKTSCA